MKKESQAFSYQTTQPLGNSDQDTEWSSDLDCDRCPHNGPFVIIKKRQNQKSIEVMCPKCHKIRNVKAAINPKNGEFQMENNKIKVIDEPIGPPILQSSKIKSAQKRNLDGIPTKDSFKGPRYFKQYEEVNPQGKNTIGPFTKEREEYKLESKVFQATSNTKNPIQTKKAKEILQLTKEAKTNKNLSELEKQIIASPNKTITEAAKIELAKTAAMYPQISVLPANGAAQWCPKIRNTISMDVCATKCIDGRRIPQTEGFEKYQDYLIQGGDPNGKVHCGYKDWLKREVDAFYPGWVEDHIKRMGGEVVGSETNYGNRRMNLDDGERRHMPRYPEEKLVELQLEQRHNYVPEKKVASKQAQCIIDEFPEETIIKEKQCKCEKGKCKCKKIKKHLH